LRDSTDAQASGSPIADTLGSCIENLSIVTTWQRHSQLRRPATSWKRSTDATIVDQTTMTGMTGLPVISPSGSA